MHLGMEDYEMNVFCTSANSGFGNGCCITHSSYVISISSVTHHNERHAFRCDIVFVGESCNLLPECSVWFRNAASLGNPTLSVPARKVLHNTRELNYFCRIHPRKKT